MTLSDQVQNLASSTAESAADSMYPERLVTENLLNEVLAGQCQPEKKKT